MVRTQETEVGTQETEVGRQKSVLRLLDCHYLTLTLERGPSESTAVRSLTARLAGRPTPRGSSI